MLLLTREGGVSILGGGSCEKHTTITVKLSQELRLRASLTSSLEHLSGSLCIINSFLAIVTAHWLLITSHNPSQPIIKNSSSSVRLISCNSGSALRGHAEPLGPFMCQSPRARETDSCPFKYPSYTTPPSLSILSLSEIRFGFWSVDISTALPRLPSTALQSPALATIMVLSNMKFPQLEGDNYLPLTRVVKAVVPEEISNELESANA
ncbi:hypothetical protein Ahy_A07g034890 isoform C [Arachis hypogaea]|uniref:Uncharacterized protein n=1 Tax=Arachis hypogaea TaxID=3818 RepID=A0A445CCZ4_ARAHY|nr:hypothetical protein Ahy_A07g034890 isoform C [Arachis hypogaea]